MTGSSPTPPPGHPPVAEPASGPHTMPPWARRLLQAGIWKRVRPVVTMVVLVVAVVLVTQHRDEIGSAVAHLRRVDWRWLAAAVVLEALSMVTFARLQGRLLTAGGGRLRMPYLLALTTAANSISSTLPGGVAFAAAWEFEQLERHGIRRLIRVWAFVVAGAVSSFTLFVLLAWGVLSAGGSGPLAPLRWLVTLLLGLAAVTVVGVVARRTRPVRATVAGLRRQLGRMPGGERLLGASTQLVQRFESVRLGPLGWLELLALGLANWLTDCGVVVVGLLALHVPVPWDDILVVYGFTQIGAAVNITPGGLGVVAGSLAGLLSAYGVHTGAALATTILYRLLTFWVLVPIGWLVWLGLDVQQRHGHLVRRPSPAATGPAGPDDGGTSTPDDEEAAADAEGPAPPKAQATPEAQAPAEWRPVPVPPWPPPAP